MLRDLIISVISGVVVALILQIFGFGRSKSAAPSQTMTMNNYKQPRRRSMFGGLVRLVLAVAGGIAFAQAAAPFIFGRVLRSSGAFERYEALTPQTVVIGLTVLGTIIAWMILSAITRR